MTGRISLLQYGAEDERRKQDINSLNETRDPYTPYSPLFHVESVCGLYYWDEIVLARPTCLGNYVAKLFCDEHHLHPHTFSPHFHEF